MELEQISILVIILGVCTLGYIGFQSDLGTLNTNYYDSDFNNTFINIEDEASRINQSEGQLFSEGVNSDFGFLPTVQSFMGVGQILKSSLGTIEQMIQDMVSKLAIPQWIVISFSSILTIMFVYAIYRATLGRQRL